MVQRFCKACGVWYDEGCLTADGEPARLEGSTATEILRGVPYVRGYNTTKKAVRWTTIGTGIMHELVEMHEGEVDSNGSMEEQWAQWEEIFMNEDAKEALVPKVTGYVAYVQKAKFGWFECATCGELI